MKRWPVIQTGVINDIINAQERIRASNNDNKQEALAEGIDIIREISKLKYEMSRDFILPCVLYKLCSPSRPNPPSSKIEQDDGPNVDEFNSQLEALGDNATWFKAPWLYAE